MRYSYQHDSKRSAPEGMTLIEIMIVVAIIGVVVVGAAFSLGATGNKVRSGAVRIAAAFQYAYHRALSQGSTLRVRFEITGSEHKMTIEEAAGNVTLTNPDDEGSEDGSVDPWAAAESRLGSTLKASLGESAFGPIMTNDGKVLKKFQLQKINDGTFIERVIVPHLPKAATEGSASVYFFPQGRSERSVIHVRDRDGDKRFTIALNPLTAQSKILKGYVELEDAFGGEVRDPG